MHQQRWRWETVGVSGGIGLAFGALACSGEAVDTTTSVVHADLEAAPNADALLSSSDCDTLLTAVRAELFDQLAQTVNSLRIGRGLASSVEPDTAPAELGAVGLALAAAAPAPGETAADVDGVSSGFSTPTLVPGVDDGDFVKAEGDRIYMIDMRTSTLHVLAGWPSTGVQLLASVPIQGAAAELLVHEGVVSVYSRIAGELDGMPSASYPSYEPLFTKVTVVDTTVTPAAIRREAYVEGDYVLSRRIGSVAHMVTQQSPKVVLEQPELGYDDIFGRSLTAAQLEEEIASWARVMSAAIEASTLEDYLPGLFEYENGFPVNRGACEDYFVSPHGGLGATSVVSVDLSKPEAPVANVTVQGLPAGVTFDSEALVVGDRMWREWRDGRDKRTQLHLFALEGAQARYLASGSTSGYASNIARSGDLIRLTTGLEAYDDNGYVGNAHHVVTFAREDGRLSEVAASPQLEFNNSITVARFIGDRAYVVGSSATRSEGIAHDALVVVDYSDPSSPQIAGRVPVFGDISALLPAADGRLLGIAAGVQGVALQLLDVSDSSAPAIAAEYLYPDASNTSAVGDARAIAFSPERNLIAFPVANQQYSTTLELFEFSADSLTHLGSVVPPLPPLPLLDCLASRGYPTDPASIARIEADPVLRATVLAECERFRPGPDVVRGWFRDNAVLAVGTSRVAAFGLDALTEPPLSQVELP